MYYSISYTVFYVPERTIPLRKSIADLAIVVKDGFFFI